MIIQLKFQVLFLGFLFLFTGIQAQKEGETPGINDFVVVDEEPQVLNLREVQEMIGYPAEAVNENIQGYVVVRTLVDEEGKYMQHKVLRSVSPILTSAVETHIHKLRFTPALVGGDVLKFWVNVPFNFRLTDTTSADTRIRQVITSLDEKLKESPNDYEAYLQRGLQYKELGEFEKSRQDIDKSLAVNPQKNKKKGDNYIYLYYAQLSKGKVYNLEKKWTEARDILHQAIATAAEVKNRDSVFLTTIPNAYLERGIAYANLKETHKAYKDFDYVIANDEESKCFALAFKYDLSIRQKDYPAILSCLEELLICEPDNELSIFFNRGYYKILSGQYENALPDFEMVLDKSASPLIRIAANNQMAKAYMKMGKFEEAKAKIDEASNINVLHPQPLFYRGLLLLEQGDKEGACKQFQNALNFGLEGDDKDEAEKLVGESCR